MWIRFHMGVVPVWYRCNTVGTRLNYRQITVGVPGGAIKSVNNKVQAGARTFLSRLSQPIAR